MISFFEIVPMITAQSFGTPHLDRTPEPDSVMHGQANVEEFDQVLDSKLAIAYAAALDVIYRVRNTDCVENAVDLACGPGHFSIFLSQKLGYKKVTGIDLSRPMLKAAEANAGAYGAIENVRFELGDATALDRIDNASCDLATFNDAAHHMPDLATVTRVLAEMERITKTDGTIFVMDLVRLKNAALTERYINSIGADYLKRGLTSFFEDFRNSMYAAWTSDELKNSVPHGTKRNWYQIIPWGLPTIQMLVGVPGDQTKLFNRKPALFPKNEPPVRAT